MIQIAVLPAESQQSTLANLIQFYLYELSELEQLDIAADGRFADDGLHEMIDEPGSHTFLIAADSALVGFALVGRRSRLHADFDGHSVSAFFIARRHRRRGIGSQAAAQIFDRFPGRWEIATYGVNVPALAFWRSVADSYTTGRYEESWLQGAIWRGTIQSFSTPPRSAEHLDQH